MSNFLQPDEQVDNDRYRVVRMIGKGGMGAVYEAIDQRMKSTVALKQMFSNPNLSPQQTATLEKAFEREAKILHNLRHPSLPRVSDHFLESRGNFLVMDYIEGNDMGAWLENRMRMKGTPFSEQEVIPKPGV